MGLPALAFGAAVAAVHRQPDELVESMQALLPNMYATPLSRGATFRAATSHRMANGVAMTSNAMAETDSGSEQSGGWHFIMPCEGAILLRCDGTEQIIAARRSAIMLPNIARELKSSAVSLFGARIDIAEVSRLAAALCGPDATLPTITERPYLFHLELRPAAFAALMALCRLLDSTRDDPDLGEQLGLGRLVQQWIASALVWKWEALRETGPTPAPNTRLDELCDIIRASKDRFLRLDELCEVSGLSARTLQYAFNRRFDCSPMEWQRRERMSMAREKLLEDNGIRSITEIAMMMVYSSSAAFSVKFRRNYEETPSEALNMINKS